MTSSIYRTILIALALTLASCEKYLDAKPDQQLITPSSVKDLQAILDYELMFNSNYLAVGEIASDNYYLTATDYNALPELIRNFHTWHPSVDLDLGWSNSYQKVFHANVVLDNIDKVSNKERFDADAVKGGALFFRALTFFTVSQVYSLPYEASTAVELLGIPLILSSDINTIYSRPSIAETYQRVLTDLIKASILLPDWSSPVTRPNKAAAYGLLSYVFLIMGDFENSNIYADKALAIKSELMDYNTIANSNNPFTRFNTEVIFQARQLSNTNLAPSRAKVDSNLYKSYATDDLRKTLYFRNNNNGSYAFKGSYDGNAAGANLFCGITVDEIYLLKAESLARLGETEESLEWLNRLLRTRWKTNTYIDYAAGTAEQALTIILQERRKELAFRGRRWSDIRRLNNEPGRETTIKRVIDGTEYLLVPGDLRYAFLIPPEVIQFSGIEQNKR